MGKLTAVLRSRNLYAEVTSSAAAAWRCHCFGRAQTDSKIWLDSEVIDMSNSHVTKHLFVTGGVASSLGKGLTASSLGRLMVGTINGGCAVINFRAVDRNNKR